MKLSIKWNPMEINGKYKKYMYLKITQFQSTIEVLELRSVSAEREEANF